MDMRQTQRLIQRSLLRAFESDLQRSASARRLGGKQVRERNAERRRKCPQQGQLGFASAVFDERQMTRSPAYGGTDLIERQPLRPAVMPQPVAERQKIYGGWRDLEICHSFTIAKESLIFRAWMY